MITVDDLIRIALPDETLLVAGGARSAVRSLGPRARVPALRLRPSQWREAGAAYTPGAEQPRQATDARCRDSPACRVWCGCDCFRRAGQCRGADVPMMPESRCCRYQLKPICLLEREASHVIAERKREVQRLGHDASRRLMEQAIAGESLADLAGTLAEMANKDVVIEDGWSPAGNEQPNRAGADVRPHHAIAGARPAADDGVAESCANQARPNLPRRY